MAFPRLLIGDRPNTESGPPWFNASPWPPPFRAFSDLPAGPADGRFSPKSNTNGPGRRGPA